MPIDKGDFAILGPGLARVVLRLPRQFLGPAGVEDTVENLADESLLVSGAAANRRVGNGPVVRDVQAQGQPAVALLVPVEAHRLFLPVSKRFVQGLDCLVGGAVWSRCLGGSPDSSCQGAAKERRGGCLKDPPAVRL